MRRLMRERRAAAALRVNVMATTSVGKRPGQASGVSRSRGAASEAPAPGLFGRVPAGVSKVARCAAVSKCCT